VSFIMLPFRNKLNNDTHTVGTRRYVSFLHQIECLDTNNEIK